MAQIGYDWWQFLPADFEDNPYARQEIMVQPTTDENIGGFASLDLLWNASGDDFHYAVDALVTANVLDYTNDENGVSTDVPLQGADDFTGSYTVMSTDGALYVLYNIKDDQFVFGSDFAEMHFAPYAEKHDPGKTIYPDMSRSGFSGYWWDQEQSHVWGWDSGTGMPFGWATIITGDNYVEMSKYGSWNDVGAYKVDLPLASSGEVFAQTVAYTLKGDNLDTLGNVGGGTIPVAMQTVFEQTADGYFFLCVIPWDLMPSGKMENIGDQISFAAKMNDFDDDNFVYKNGDGNDVTHRYDYWGGTTDNNAYWAIAYFGARATLTGGPLAIADLDNTEVNAYYVNNKVVIDNDAYETTVRIYNVNGTLVGQSHGENQVDVSYLNAGYYVANIFDNDGNTTVLKFVKAIK